MLKKCLIFTPKKLIRVPLVMAALALGLFSDVSAAAVYIYRLPGGSEMITDHLLDNKQYKLIRASTHIKGMGTLLASRNSPIMLADPSAYDALIKKAARRNRVEAALIKAVMHVESGFNPYATSKRGALGLMQLMPETARRYGVTDVFDAKQNVQGGALYLKDLLKKFKHNHRLVLAAYNAGENAVLKYNGVPPYSETQDYVRRVLQFRGQYAKSL